MTIIKTKYKICKCCKSSMVLNHNHIKFCKFCGRYIRRLRQNFNGRLSFQKRKAEEKINSLEYIISIHNKRKK